MSDTTELPETPQRRSHILRGKRAEKASVTLPSAPVESAPVESAPLESAPLESAPLESAPLESAPVESAPVESAPLESAPLESAPVESAPVESAPVESEEEAPVKPYTSSTYLTIGSEHFHPFIESTTMRKGAPNLLSLDDFTNRFSTDLHILKTIIRYWSADGTYATATKSNPIQNTFRIPCNPKDITILHSAFTTYLGFLERQVKVYEFQESDEKEKWKLQHSLVENYLEALEQPINTLTCIPESDLEPINLEYSTVLPKLFYLMYRKAKEHKPLNLKELFIAYPDLTRDVQRYLTELENDKAKSAKEDPNLYQIAEGIIQTYEMLPKLFPEKYGNLALADIKLDNVPNELNPIVEKALKAYNENDTKAFTEQMNAIFIYIERSKNETVTKQSELYGKILDIVSEQVTALKESLPESVKEEFQNSAEPYAADKQIEMQERIEKFKKNMEQIKEYLEGVADEEKARSGNPALTASAVQEGGSIFSPSSFINELHSLLAKQSAWDVLSETYESLEPYYKSLVAIEPAPIKLLQKQFSQYINDHADPDALEEARTAVGLLSPEDLEACISNKSPAILDRIILLYKAALPRSNEMLVSMIIADIIETLGL